MPDALGTCPIYHDRQFAAAWQRRGIARNRAARRIIVGISGASCVVYGVRLLELLRTVAGVPVLKREAGRCHTGQGIEILRKAPERIGGGRRGHASIITEKGRPRRSGLRGRRACHADSPRLPARRSV